MSIKQRSRPYCLIALQVALVSQLAPAPRVLATDPLVSFVIEATRPDVVGPDMRGPDFSHCDGVCDAFGQTFTDFPVESPNAPSGINVHDDGLAVHRSVRDPLWWRYSLMTMSGNVHGTFRQEVANRGALHWFNGVGYPEILSFFEDGGVRPDVAFDVPQTGTVRFGPLEFNAERGRRFADVESIDMLPSGDTLQFTYGSGEEALLIVEQATPEKSRFRIEVDFAPNANGLVMETTNMFRDPLVNDTALVRAMDANGLTRIHPVLDFPGGLLTEVMLFRDEFSRHNSLGPDIRIGEFTFENAAGERYLGPLLVTNDSVVTDCAEEDNVVLSFSIFTTVAGEKTWGVDAGGQASVGANWFGGVAPTGANESVAFTTIVTADRTMQLDAALSLARLRFDDDNNYTLAGPQAVTFAATGDGPANLLVENIHGNGAHTISAPVILADDLSIVHNSSGELLLRGALNNPGHAITKSGSGKLSVAGAQSHAAGATLSVSAGTANINTNAGSATARNLSVTANSTTNFGSTQHLNNLSIGASATATLTAGGSKVLVSNVPTIAGATGAWTGTLNMTDNAAILDNAGTVTASAVREHIISGRGGPGPGGKWTGTGITSSTAAAANGAQPDSHSLGYADNATLPLGAYSSFHGAAVDESSILIAFTRTGDANLDGVVNDDDVTIVGATYAPGVPQPSWALGDFDYNGFVDDDDVTLLGAFYNPSAPPLATPASGAAVAGVPEPASLILALVAVVGVCVLIRRRHACCRRST